MRLLDQWIQDYNLDAVFNDENSFRLNNQDYLYIQPKEGKIFDENFNLIVSEDEDKAILIDNYCFEFGGKMYYTSLKNNKVSLNLLKNVGKIKEQSGFSYLGVHGGFELCSGSRPYTDWCKKAKFLGIDALGVCEKHTLAGAIKFQLACDKAGIKSIIGETVTVKGKNNDYKVKLYVSNEVGWRNLLRIHKIINIDNEGKFIDEPILIGLLKGLFLVFNHDTLLSDEILAEYHHSKSIGVYFQFDPVQYKAVKRDIDCLNCLRLALKLEIPLALICDSYYLEKQDFKVKQILQFIGNTGFEYQSENQYFKSMDDVALQCQDMFATKGVDFAFEVLGKAIEGVEEISSNCNFKIKLGEIHLPKYTLTEEEQMYFSDSDELFWHLVEIGLREKITEKGKDTEKYIERIGIETDIISRGGFIDYFLIIRDIINWSEKNGIMTGTGRGSIGGSIVAFLLGITKVDAVENGLIFERFLNESRIGKGLPDIDSDYHSGRRQEVIEYMKERFGDKNICAIGTYSLLKTKSAFRDLLRFTGEQPQTINYFAAILPDSDFDFTAFMFEISQSAKLKDFVSERSGVVNDMELILGQPRSTSIHAAGIVITPTEYKGKKMEVFDWFPCKKIDGMIISEWEGPQLDDAGFLKADILGLSQLDKLDDILKLIESNKGVKLNLIDLDRDDKDVFELFHKGMTQDVFQFTTDGLSSYCREAKPDSIMELSVLTSLYRPGPMDIGAHHDYVKIKFGKKEAEYDWRTESILKETLGLMVFQEQILKIVQELAGFTLTEADTVRKNIGKKLLDKMKLDKDKFVSGCVKNGCFEYEAIKIWNKIEGFAQYSFNLSHAYAYSWIGYQCQWLKKHYPLEFWTISLQHASEDDVPKRISELRKFENLNLYGPNINLSGEKFYTDWHTDSIYWSLAKIKYVGEAVLKSILDERNANGKYFSISEFHKRLKGKRVNKKASLNLILTGCFDEMYKIKFVSDRLKLVVELYKCIGEDVPVEYSAKDEYSWFRWQKDLSGFGYFDYKKIVTQLGFDSRRYVEPDKLQLESNVDIEVIVVGIVREAIKRKTKKGDMLKLIVDCNDELINVVLWNDTYSKFYKKMEECEGKCVALNAMVQYDNFNKKNSIYSFGETEIEIF